MSTTCTSRAGRPYLQVFQSLFLGGGGGGGPRVFWGVRIIERYMYTHIGPLFVGGRASFYRLLGGSGVYQGPGILCVYIRTPS